MKPIIFNIEMIKAILDGRKTQTRRVFSKTQLKYFDYAQKLGEMNSLDDLHKNDFSYILQFSKYKVGHILYVKEKFCIGAYANDGGCETNGYSSETYISQCSFDNNIIYYADAIDECDFSNLEKDELPSWKPSVHLKQKDARIFLKVTNVRVERLQDISEDDLEKEGIISYSEQWQNMECECTKNNRCQRYCDRRLDFINLWNSTAKDGYKWEDNPYVFVYEFERVKLGEVK